MTHWKKTEKIHPIIDGYYNNISFSGNPAGVVGRTNLLPKNTIQDLIKDLEKKTLCPTDDMYKFVDCLREKTMEELVNATDFHWTLFRS
jgi:hypothetical protein